MSTTTISEDKMTCTVQLHSKNGYNLDCTVVVSAEEKNLPRTQERIAEKQNDIECFAEKQRYCATRLEELEKCSCAQELDAVLTDTIELRRMQTQRLEFFTQNISEDMVGTMEDTCVDQVPDSLTNASVMLKLANFLMVNGIEKIFSNTDDCQDAQSFFDDYNDLRNNLSEHESLFDSLYVQAIIHPPATSPASSKE